MESNQKLSLVMPRQSPKMSAIYGALEEGWPGAKINSHDFDKYVLWGLIQNNMLYMTGDFIFTDMPYNGRLEGENYDESFWRWCVKGIHDNRKLDVPSDRFEQWNMKVESWKNDGEHILLCPSSETMTFYMHGCNVNEWITKTSNEIKEYTNREIRVRYKPRKNGTSGPSVADTPLSDDLANAHCCVLSGSLVAVECLRLGVPVFGTSHFAPSAWCTNWDISNIEKPYKYDREHLFYNLAYKQYSINEMRNGTCYENSQKYLFDN